MTQSRVRVRRLAVALATAACLLGGSIPALAGDKDKKPSQPGQEAPAPPPAAETDAPAQQQAAPPPAQGQSRPKQRGNGNGNSGSGRRSGREDKPKKPEDEGSAGSDATGGGTRGSGDSATGGSSGSSGQGSTATPQPVAPTPTPAPGGDATPAPGTDTNTGAGNRGRERAARERRSRRERASEPAGGSVLGTTEGGEPAVAPLGPVGVAAEAAEESARQGGERAGADTGFRADEGGSFPPVTQTVQEIVEVVPGPIKAALAGLAIVALLFAFQSLVASSRARRLARQREDLLDEVGLLQAALLPTVPQRLGDLVSTVAYRPADGPAAGGDFYDAFAFDGGRVGVIVGDVSGHGREALARTALMRYTLRAYLDAGLEPRAALKVAGSVLDDDLGADFATVVVAVYDPEAGTLTYAGAGHPPPILLGPPAHEPVTACSSPPIGAGATTGLRQTTLALPQGSIACFFTDGMTDARVGDRLLGRERLAELLAELGPEVTAPALLERVAEVCDRTPDDMAACIVRANGSGSGRLRVEELEVSRKDLQGTAVVRFLEECGIAASDVPELLRIACDTARESGSAVFRVRLGDWRPGVDVLPGNVATLAAARKTSAALAQTS